MILTKLDQYVNEMMTMAVKKFKNLRRSRFLIIMQNVNMVANGKRNSRLNPYVPAFCGLFVYNSRLQTYTKDSSNLYVGSQRIPRILLTYMSAPNVYQGFF